MVFSSIIPPFCGKSIQYRGGRRGKARARGQRAGFLCKAGSEFIRQQQVGERDEQQRIAAPVHKQYDKNGQNQQVIHAEAVDNGGAAEKLAADGIGVEVIDLRSLYPLDKELIGESIAKTHKAIVITEEVKRGGFGGEISAIIGEEFFDYLDAPVIRIGALDTPVPFAPNLEQYYIPNAQDILVAAKKMF